MIIFILLLRIFAIKAPGVSGGTVMASLGLITSVLGFDLLKLPYTFNIYPPKISLAQPAISLDMDPLPL